jgi:predicted alpha/beta-hydrolase family hydrolase
VLERIRKGLEGTDARRDTALVAGGKSMGGRIASQVAAQNGFDPAPPASSSLGIPCIRRNQPNKRRDEHLPKIPAPMLFLHGTRDPFGTPEEMQATHFGHVGRHVASVDGGDHSLVVKRKDGADSVERAVAVAADWMKPRQAFSA